MRKAPIARLHDRELPFPRLSLETTGSGVRFWTDAALEAASGVRMGFTERAGGLSSGPYASLNLGRFAGEGEEAARANMRHLMEAAGCAEAALINPQQVHGTRAVMVLDGAPEAIAAADAAVQEGADALVVGVPDVFALLGFADCVPVVMVSPASAFAVAHAGWRGAHGRIVSKTLGVLADLACAEGAFASRQEAAAACNIYIGPYIHAECFEVSADVHGLFSEEFGRPVCPDASHVDLGAVIRADAVGAGADTRRIADVDACTVCNEDRFFSYRASGGVCGRHGAFVVRK